MYPQGLVRAPSRNLGIWHLYCRQSFRRHHENLSKVAGEWLDRVDKPFLSIMAPVHVVETFGIADDCFALRSMLSWCTTKTLSMLPGGNTSSCIVLHRLALSYVVLYHGIEGICSASYLAIHTNLRLDPTGEGVCPVSTPQQSIYGDTCIISTLVPISTCPTKLMVCVYGAILLMASFLTVANRVFRNFTSNCRCPISFMQR